VGCVATRRSSSSLFAAKIAGSISFALRRQARFCWRRRGFFDHRLRREESLRDKADYILHNPVRKGLVARPEDWPRVWMPQQT
jgi:hypothetical protein